MQQIVYTKNRRNLNGWYKENIHNMRHNKDNSKYTKLILDAQDKYGKNEDNKENLKIMPKEKHVYLAIILHTQIL
jgi:hypothetical protein